ncbi:MAG: hypothetical protein JEY79_14160 [Pseudodesulfovibrio sp.]|nr:hypothetical protein [Pseudodesulfovibrio sp.]
MNEIKLFSPCDSCPHRDVPHGECLSCTFTEAQARLLELDTYANKALEYLNLEDGDKDAFKELRRAFGLENRFVCVDCGDSQELHHPFTVCHECGGDIETRVVKIRTNVGGAV